jgi:Hemerythrin HHE cation binding domain
MTLQQTLQANTGKTKELFDKLAQTSDQAVKTRENLFGDLARELRLHAEVEQKHVLPALRGNDKTKELAADAARTNKELRGKVDELEALPKGDAEFLPRLGELRKLFQQQLREERQELVPAVRQLGDEKAEAVAARIEATRERADDEQRAEAEARRAEARREAEARQAAESGKQAAAAVATAAKANARELGRSAAEAVDSGKQKAAEAVDTTRQKAHDAVDATKQKAAELRDSAREASDKAADGVKNAAVRVRAEAKRVKDEAAETVSVLRDTARERGADVKAVGSALRSFGKVGGEVRQVVVGSIKRSGRDSLEMGKQILRNPKQFGRVQRDYAAAATRNLMESANQIFGIVRSASAAARQPIEQRLRTVS